MADSTFDPEQFLNTTVEDSFDTSLTPVPPGEYNAHIENIKFRQMTRRDTGEAMYVMDVNWSIDDEDVKKQTELDNPMARQSVFLDVTEDGQGLDFGKNKNVQLGRLRESVGQNQPGKPWSPGNLQGAQARVQVQHSPNQNNPESPYVNVTRVAAIS